MKQFDTQKQQRLIREQQKRNLKARTLFLAKGKERAMRRAFKGIQPYKSRKILFEIGQKHGR